MSFPNVHEYSSEGSITEVTMGSGDPELKVLKGFPFGILRQHGNERNEWGFWIELGTL